MKENTDKKGFKSGFVTIVGRPNVGKSTLLNLILGEKISIVSKRPQTTRNRINGIKNTNNAQIVFIDTPGLHQSKKSLNELMVKQAVATLTDVDIIVFMAEPVMPGPEDDEILKLVTKANAPVILVINKIDTVKKSELLPLIKAYSEKDFFSDITPVSCLKRDGVELLMERIVDYLPCGEPFFPPDMITDRTERFLVSELIREKLFQFTRMEIPYSSAVVVDKFEEDNKKEIIRIIASIYVERESQKGIVVGKGGKMLKLIGTRAREDMERLLGSKVFLKLWVGVKKDWTKDVKRLKEFGF